MSGLNLKVNYLVGAQAKCQAGGLAQATGLRLFTESGCDELPQCQLIETESNKCFSSHRQKPLCNLADGLGTRRGFLGTEVAEGREGDCLTAARRDPKGHRCPGPEGWDRDERPFGAHHFGKVHTFYRRKHQRPGAGACLREEETFVSFSCWFGIERAQLEAEQRVRPHAKKPYPTRAVSTLEHQQWCHCQRVLTAVSPSSLLSSSHPVLKGKSWRKL